MKEVENKESTNKEKGLNTEELNEKAKDIMFWRKYNIAYCTVILLIYFHISGLYGGYLLFSKAKWMTLILSFTTWFLSSLGIAVGAHKLWSHRSFAASRPLEVFLMLCHSMSMQFTVYKWVAIHRQHHRYSDSSKDPHDATRGLFYSHIGWLMVRKPGGVWDPHTVASMDDITANPVLEFQRRHATWLLPFAAFILPTITPLLWSEDISTSYHTNIFRFIINLNMALTVNSLSHTWGYRPYDKRIKAYQNWLIIFLTLGEGHHNFHHSFPNDYRACEEDQRWTNVMAMFVDICAKFGLAKDLKVADGGVVKLKKEKTGDGSDFGRNVLEYLGLIK